MKSVLLIEDEKFIRDIYRTKFKEAKIRLFEAISTKEADNILDEKTIDLIILDLILPKENGLDYLKRIRERGVSAPVVILSNLEGKSYRERAKELGAKKYLLKTDVTPSEFVKLIKNYLL